MTNLARAVIVACISATMMLLGVAPIARAETVPLIDDPLHGHCLAGCIDNGTNTPIIGPTNGFYFQASPGPQTGILVIDILVPNSIPPIKLPNSIPMLLLSGAEAASSKVTFSASTPGPRARSVPTSWLLVAPTRLRILARPIRSALTCRRRRRSIRERPASTCSRPSWA
jgi:hypothetical protein